MSQARANVAVAVVDNRLYAVGGFSGKNFLNTIEYLDINSNEWTTFIPKMKDDGLSCHLQQGVEINLDSFKYKFINGLHSESREQSIEDEINNKLNNIDLN